MFSSVSPGTNVEFYADDTKIWREIDYSSDRLPYKVIKLMIFKVGQWSITNKMKFHPPECKAVSITNQRNVLHDLPFKIFLYKLIQDLILERAL